MDVIKQLTNRCGTYRGAGVNHEGQPFTGSLTLAPGGGGRGLVLQFVATGHSGETYHAEQSLIGPNLSEGLSLWILSTNHPAVMEHRLVPGPSSGDGFSALTFRCGDRENPKTFREDVTLELWNNGDITYRYAWGMPGGSFADRSGARMSPVSGEATP